MNLSQLLQTCPGKWCFAIPDVDEIINSANGLKTIRRLMGSTQDGSQTHVRLFQDDATGCYELQTHGTAIWAETFTELLKKAEQL